MRELGGLYVLGTERHESRRIDNQLRGRSGRQGDPGESRFYLSLEDDLMRLFATGAMSWVMGKALPDDVPIEAKMVTKAIERAQNTVEARNAEIRKDVLKYDEVMNEQRKVDLPAPRMQILDGDDLRDEALRDPRRRASTTVVDDVLRHRLRRGLGPRRPARRGQRLLPDAVHRRGAGRGRPRPRRSTRACVAEAIALLRAARGGQLGAPTSCARSSAEVMLAIIDQRWREHLYEMDYLQEGINLRAMGQKDPLVEWQREGYDMFGQMMDGHRRRLREVRHARSRSSSSSRRARASRNVPVLGGRGPRAGRRRRAPGRPPAPRPPSDRRGRRRPQHAAEDEIDTVPRS